MNMLHGMKYGNDIGIVAKAQKTFDKKIWVPPPFGPLKKNWSPTLTTPKNSGPPHKQTAPPLPIKNDSFLTCMLKKLDAKYATKSCNHLGVNTVCKHMTMNFSECEQYHNISNNKGCDRISQVFAHLLPMNCRAPTIKRTANK